MDTIRRLSYIGIIISITTLVLLYFTTREEIALMTFYVLMSLSLFFYTISMQSCKTQQNQVLYDIMKYSKKVRKTIINYDIQSDYIKNGDEKAVYFDNDTNGSVRLGNNMSVLGASGIASLYFNLPSVSATNICCNPIYLKWYNFVKIVYNDDMVETKIIKNDWLIPNNPTTQYFVNGTIFCTYNSYCVSPIVRFLSDSIWYICTIAILLVSIKIFLYSYKIFQTPVMSITREYDNIEACVRNDAKVYNNLSANKCTKKIVTTNHYCSVFRIAFVVLYIISFTTIFIWIHKAMKVMPTVSAVQITNASEIRYNGVLITYEQFLKLAEIKNDRHKRETEELSCPENIISVSDEEFLLIANNGNNTKISEIYNIKRPNNILDSKITESMIDDMKRDCLLKLVDTKNNSLLFRIIEEKSETPVGIKSGFDFIDETGAMRNMTCKYDKGKYALYGIINADCIYDPDVSGVTFSADETINKYVDIDKRCTEMIYITYARNGMPMCIETCKTTFDKRRQISIKGDCSIVFSPNSKKSKSTPRSDSNKNVKALNMDNYEITGLYETINIRYKIKRSKRDTTGGSPSMVTIRNSVIGYGEGTYVFEGWSTQFTNRNGAIFLTERDSSDTKCMETEWNKGTQSAVCSHKRRQMISCEPNLYGIYSIDSNSFVCSKPTNVQLNAMPLWRKTGIKIPYAIPENKEAGELDKIVGSATIGTGSEVSSIKFEVLWGKKYQDSVQSIGGMKYHIYSMLLKITQTNAKSTGSSFPQAWNRILDKHNIWESRYFDNSYHMHRKMPTTAASSLYSGAISVKHIERPSDNNMLQDRAYVNFVLKSDIYTSDGKLLDPLSENWDNNDDCVKGNTNNECTYIFPMYYAIRVYGPLLADINIFGSLIDTIAFDNNVCSSVNAIRIKSICYFPDMNTVSTDVVAGGYPWTNWSMLMSSERNSQYEMPSFYLNHPKIGSGQYMAKVSDSANIGFFSVDGPCSDTYYKDEKLHCDGLPSVNIKLVEYTSFHRPLLSNPICNVHQNNSVVCKFSDPTKIVICNHDINKSEMDRKCTTNTTTVLIHNVEESTGYTVKTPIAVYQYQRGKGICSSCFTVFIQESYYRCAWCVVLLFLGAGIGFVAVIIHLLLSILFYINSYNIGRIMRFLKIGFFLNRLNTPVCRYCNMYMYNEIEDAKHRLSCNNNRCPYCITLNKDNDICALGFPNKANFKKHMELHQSIRTNPYIGLIKIKRSSVVTFLLIPLIVSSNLQLVNGQYFGTSSGLRSNRLGVNISLPSDSVNCDYGSCKIINSYKARIPLSDGSTIVVRTVKDNVVYSKKITIENPHMDVSCDYQYTASSIKVGNKRVVYACLGKTECNNNDQNAMLTTPIANRENVPQFIPLDPYNPLKSYYCPKAVVCKSPIVDLMWLEAGCWTIDDGTAIGYEYYMPDVSNVMAHVFRCTVNSIKYKICEGTLCKNIDGSSSDLEKGEIKFEHISDTLPVQFTVAATSKQGEDKPNHLYYNPPEVGANTDNTVFEYKMTRIPQGDTCLAGTEYNGGSCEINVDGTSPSINCHHNSPKMDDHNLVKQYQSLSDVFHCNFEDSLLTWQSEILSRTVNILGKDVSDTQTGSWPSLNLTSVNCNFGHIDVDMISLNQVSLELVKYTGKISKATCSGLYNRNHMMQITFGLTDHNGMIEIHCPNYFKDSCLFDTGKVNWCNTTTMLPFNGTCSYNGADFYLDCSNLAAFEADPTSGHTIGWTGSESINTWISGFNLGITKWWNITLLVIGLILTIILIIWVIRMCFLVKINSRVTREYSEKKNMDYDDYETILIRENDYRKVTESPIRRRVFGSKITN